jgi:hypothetical protein
MRWELCLFVLLHPSTLQGRRTAVCTSNQHHRALATPHLLVLQNLTSGIAQCDLCALSTIGCTHPCFPVTGKHDEAGPCRTSPNVQALCSSRRQLRESHLYALPRQDSEQVLTDRLTARHAWQSLLGCEFFRNPGLRHWHHCERLLARLSPLYIAGRCCSMHTFS